MAATKKDHYDSVHVFFFDCSQNSYMVLQCTFTKLTIQEKKLTVNNGNRADAIN